MAEFNQMHKELTPTLYNLFWKGEHKEILFNSYYDAGINLIPKLIQKENCTSVSLIKRLNCVLFLPLRRCIRTLSPLRSLLISDPFPVNFPLCSQPLPAGPVSPHAEMSLVSPTVLPSLGVSTLGT